MENIVRTACDILKDLNGFREKSDYFQGLISGDMKQCLENVRGVILMLARRVENAGDVTYLKRKNDELSGQIRAADTELNKLRSQVAASDQRMTELEADVRRIRALYADSMKIGASRPQSMANRDDNSRME